MLNEAQNSTGVAVKQSVVGMKILVSDPVDQTLVEGLKEQGHEIDLKPTVSSVELAEEIGDYDAIVVRSRTKLNNDILQKAKKLKFIARAGIGTDNIDMESADSLGIRVITAAGSSTQSVVELNLGMLVNLSRNIVSLNLRLRSGTYKKEAGAELAGKTAGIIGFGRIGSSTARVLKSLGMNIVAYDIYENRELMEEIGGEFLPLDELLSVSDYVFVLLTLGKESQRILGVEELRKLKNGAGIINTSRAEAVDSQELLQGLKNGTIGGYASDVLWTEPPSTETEKELISLENVIITPHIGAQTVEAQKRVATVTMNNLLKAMEEYQ